MILLIGCVISHIYTCPHVILHLGHKYYFAIYLNKIVSCTSQAARQYGRVGDDPILIYVLALFTPLVSNRHVFVNKSLVESRVNSYYAAGSFVTCCKRAKSASGLVVVRLWTRQVGCCGLPSQQVS